MIGHSSNLLRSLGALLLLVSAATPSDARLKATKNRHQLSGAIPMDGQLVMGGASGGDCVTYKLAFPELCCPNSYTRVKSTRTTRSAREPGRDATKRRDRVKRAKKMLEQKSVSDLAQRRRDAWMESALGSDDDGYLADGEEEEHRSPQWSEARVSFHQANTGSIPKRLRNKLAPPPDTDNASSDSSAQSFSSYTPSQSDCPIALVHSQPSCPSAEDRHLVESYQIERLETFKELGGGKPVLVECGALGTFWY